MGRKPREEDIYMYVWWFPLPCSRNWHNFFKKRRIYTPSWVRSEAPVVPPGAGRYLQTRRSCEGSKHTDPLKGKWLKKKSFQIHRTLMNSSVVKVDSKHCSSQLLQVMVSVNFAGVWKKFFKGKWLLFPHVLKQMNQCCNHSRYILSKC